MAASHLDLTPDSTRLLARSFLPGSANFAGEYSRLDTLIRRVLDMSPGERTHALAEATDRSRPRFDDIEGIWRRQAELAARHSSVAAAVDDDDTRLLLGAYLTQAYAYEAVALTNPSMVPAGEAGPDGQRFVMTARAIGEGHISSVAFLTGSVDGQGRVRLDGRHPHVSNGTRRESSFQRDEVRSLLLQMGLWDEVSQNLLDEVGDPFTPVDVEDATRRLGEGDHDVVALADAGRRLHWIVTSNYEVEFDSGLPLSEHVLSPAAPAESGGIEDVRLVRFTDEDGAVRYLGTYTAYDGTSILPQLIETEDFHRFRMSTMSGPAAHHKGMAFFPRRVGGEYLALTRHDHERIFLARSDGYRRWPSAEVVLEPRTHRDMVQIGNCGPPIETEAGWLVLTHGVGPMRRYTVGALLLDRDRPERVVGSLPHPLLEPRDDESRGHVPDVVYSCGGMVHEDVLVIPYGYADYGIRFSVTSLDAVLGAMT